MLASPVACPHLQSRGQCPIITDAHWLSGSLSLEAKESIVSLSFHDCSSLLCQRGWAVPYGCGTSAPQAVFSPSALSGTLSPPLRAKTHEARSQENWDTHLSYHLFSPFCPFQGWKMVEFPSTFFISVLLKLPVEKAQFSCYY